jgi:hypothetical protein
MPDGEDARRGGGREGGRAEKARQNPYQTEKKEKKRSLFVYLQFAPPNTPNTARQYGPESREEGERRKKKWKRKEKKVK